MLGPLLTDWTRHKAGKPCDDTHEIYLETDSSEVLFYTMVHLTAH